MINNTYIREAESNKKDNIGLCYLLDLASRADKGFLKSLESEEDLDSLSENEFLFLVTSISALSYILEVLPDWFYDSRLTLKDPLFYDSRITDIDRVKLIIGVNSFCLSKNVFISKDSVMRV